MSEGGGTEVKFIADTMLGKLARWMRTLGCDVEYSSSMDDAGLIEKAAKEGRTILTRDTLLVKRRNARERSFFVEGDLVDAQLRQVVERFHLPRRPALTRCLRCNRPLERVEKGSVRGKVPPYVFNTQEEFTTCPSCGRLYWAGTHRQRMEEDVARLLGDDGRGGTQQ